MKRRSPLRRTKRLTRKKGLNPRAATRSEQGNYDLDKAAAWHRVIVGVPKKKKNPCVQCGSRINIEGHHVVAKQEIKRVARSARWEFDREQDALWDVRNGMPLCSRCHQQHETAFRRVPRRLVPAAAVEFARELGVEHVIDRYYPDVDLRGNAEENYPSLRVQRFRNGDGVVEPPTNESDRGEAG